MTEQVQPRGRIKQVIVGLVLLVVLGVVGKALFYVPTVVVTHLTRGQAITAVYASGSVEPTVSLKIAPKLMGRLVELVVDERAVVKAGQVLARLDDQELQANLAQMQARLDLAEREATRSATLLAHRTGTVQDRDKAMSALDEAKAGLAMAKKQQSEYTLLAPADGTIIRRDGEVGELIPANQPVFFMTTNAPLRLTAQVDEEDIPLVQVGQKVSIRADAFPGQHFEGKVEAVTPQGNATERNFRVRIALPTDTPLRIGMTTEVNIIVGLQDDAWLLPVTAVRDGKVWVMREGRLRQVTVTAGTTSSDKIAIKAGLSPEDAVVVQPEDKMKDGQKRRAAADKG